MQEKDSNVTPIQVDENRSNVAEMPVQEGT